jgi:hypothetical protein
MKDELRQADDNGRRQAEQPANRDKLLEAISNEQALLARLNREQADARVRLAALDAELASLGSEPEIRVRLPPALDAAAPQTHAKKLSLFRSLFCGRDDVFPIRFVSKKTGKSGYAPRASLPEQVRERRLRAAQGEVWRVP